MIQLFRVDKPTVIRFRAPRTSQPVCRPVLAKPYVSAAHASRSQGIRPFHSQSQLPLVQ